MSGHPRALDVLVASADRDFLMLARTVLRSAGHHVASTTVCSVRVAGQVRLRTPRVLLLDADIPTVEAVRAASADSGTAVLRVTDDPPGPADPDAPSPVHKWASATTLLDTIDGARGGAVTPQGSARLRLVRP